MNKNKDALSMLPVNVADVAAGAQFIKVELKVLNGKLMFSAWRFYVDRDGQPKPARHGLTFSIERLPEIANAFVSALAAAREFGLLPPDEVGR